MIAKTKKTDALVKLIKSHVFAGRGIQTKTTWYKSTPLKNCINNNK